ncbi:hypothetical protein HDV02_003411 [Globomyces sp. JEL0801]|nr:hypothetical protein HDV02_003411 [Globomyces sp. JEL0801]
MQKFLLRGKEAVKSDSKLKLDEDMTESMEVDPTPAKKQSAPTDLLEPQCSVPDFEMTEIESKPNAPPANVILKAKPVLLRKTGIENLISTTESHNPLNVNQLEVKLERATFSNDVYELYVKYQMKIHDDEAKELTPEKFTRFLLDTPYDVKDPNYGIFYQKYFINDKLVAVGVLDILPNCVSSVYFIYDPDFGHLSLGTYSALKEISTTIMLNQKYPDIKYYYLGYYIHSCQKMRYKAQYKPSQLLCPYTFKWVYTSDAIKLLDIEKTSILADLDSSNPIPVKLSSVPPREISLEDLRHAKLLVNHKMQPALKFINDLSLIKDIKELIQASGVDVIKDLLFIYNPE